MDMAAHTFKCYQEHYERRKKYANEYQEQHFPLLMFVGNIAAIKRQAHSRYSFAQTDPGERHFAMGNLVDIKPEYGGLHLIGKREKEPHAQVKTEVPVSQ